MAKAVSYELIDFLRDHPKEAAGMSITIDGTSFLQMIDGLLSWADKKLKEAQTPMMLTTNEVIEHYKVSRKKLYDLVQARQLNVEKDGRKQNCYYVSELNTILNKRR